jgi:glycosyltransferase involved in cell wall biosynthesis
MRILFVVPYTPNPIRVRPYEFLRALLRRGHDVTLAALWTSRAEQDDLARLAQMGVRVLSQPMPMWQSAVNSLTTVPSFTPLQAAYSWQPELFQSILALVEAHPFDAIHVEHLRGSRYGLELLRRLPRNTRPPIVWDSVDCISHLFAQAAAQSRSAKGKLMTRFELPRTERYEGRLVHTFDHTVVTSSIDKAALVALAEKSSPPPAKAPPAKTQPAARMGAPDGTSGRCVRDVIDVVPNGVDLEHFSFCGLEHRHPNRIVFSGKMSYHANVTAALHLVNDIMPAVWAQRPEVEVWLVGKDPAPELRALGDSSAGNSGDGSRSKPGEQPAGQPSKRSGNVPGAPAGRVVVTGEVPAMQDFIQSAAVAVAPLLYGAGIQNKVLEAMACGAPVVASPQASQSLAARPGEDFLVAGTPAQFAAAILSLLNSPLRRAEMGRAGRRFVETHHSWDSAVQQLESIYADCAARLSRQLVTS